MQNFHPLIVHFPIALLSAALFLELLGAMLKKPSMQDAAWWSFTLGIIACVVAAATGLFAESTVAHTDNAHEFILQHRNFEIIASILLGGLYVWRLLKKGNLPENKTTLSIQRLIMLIGVGALLIGAHLGGRLVYEFGVGTSVGPSEAHEHGSDAVHERIESAKADTLQNMHVHESHEHKH